MIGRKRGKIYGVRVLNQEYNDSIYKWIIFFIIGL